MEDNFYQYAKYHEIADFIDLSLVEIVILEYLARNSNPIVRHALYTEINQLLRNKQSDPKTSKKNSDEETQNQFYSYMDSEKQISTSSFYNTLSNLEDKGLLQTINNNHSAKIRSIKRTEFTSYIPRLLLKFLLNNNMNNAENWTEIIETFLGEIGDESFSNVLVAFFTENIITPLLQKFTEYADSLSLLSSHQTFEDMKNLNKANFKDIRFSEVFEGKIRDLNGVFDAVIAPVYKKDPKFYDIPRKEWVTEFARVTKNQGIVCLVSLSDLPLINNIFVDELIHLYKIYVKNRIFTKNELKSDLEDAGLKDIKLVEHKGLNIAIGRKSE